MRVIPVVVAVLIAACAFGAQPEPEPRTILQSSGFSGGMCVHVGCGEGELTVRLGADKKFVVHGLDPDENRVKVARERIRSAGIYGRVSVERHGPARLPYATNLINVVVVHDTGRVMKEGLSIAEVFRVLCPNGVICMREATGVKEMLKKAGFESIEAMKEHDGWVMARKPWPPEMDEWTHWRHGPDYVPVSQDTIIATPNDMRWTAGRDLGRNKTYAPLLSANGRYFYLEDETPLLYGKSSEDRRLTLKAHDAFNGLFLWKRKLEIEKSNPPKSIVVIGDRVFGVLDQGKPVMALDAATGEIVRSYDKFPRVKRLLYNDGVLIGCRSVIRAVDASTGEELWTHAGRSDDVVSGDGNVFFLSKTGKKESPYVYGCLDLKAGKEIWQRDLSAWEWPAGKGPGGGKLILVGYKSGYLAFSQPGRPCHTIQMVSAKDGSHLWHYEYRQTGHGGSPRDLCFVDDAWWFIQLGSKDASGMYKNQGGVKGLYAETGKVKAFYEFQLGKTRCHPYVSTVRYNFQGNFRMTNYATGETTRCVAARAGCRTGRLPANGLVYIPTTGCGCDVWIPGICALEANKEELPGMTDYGERLEKGSSYANVRNPVERKTSDPIASTAGSDSRSVEEWPMYRHDAARSGSTAAMVPADCTLLWTVNVGGRPTGCTVAGGRVFVASQDEYSVRAFDAKMGQALWTYTTGARVDSPPTIYRGLCLFGCRDGWVYCLGAADGTLVWRFRAAQDERLIGDHNRLESAWPVHGSVLVKHDAMFLVSGRNAALRGGIDLYRLDPKTGAVGWRQRIHVENALNPDRPSIRADILVGDNASIFMGYFKYGRFRRLAYETGTEGGVSQGNAYQGIQMGIRSGFLSDIDNDSRSFLSYRGMEARLLVYDTDIVCGFGYGGKGGKPVKIGEECFSLSLKGLGSEKDRNWQHHIGLVAHAMILTGSSLSDSGEAGKTLWLAGVRNVEKPTGGVLQAYEAAGGKKLNEIALDAKPTWDGMAAAYGRLYVSTREGTLLCFGTK